MTSDPCGLAMHASTKLVLWLLAANARKSLKGSEPTSEDAADSVRATALQPWQSFGGDAAGRGYWVGAAGNQ